jgi:chromosome segregation ATPase
MEMIKEELENSCESVSDLKGKLARANADLKHWKTKYEADALSKIEEIDEQKMKLKSKLDEVEHSKEDLASKYEVLKKSNHRLSSELKDIKTNLENSKMVNKEYEKKINENEFLSEKQRTCLNDLNEQLLQANKENKTYATELIKIRTSNADLNQKISSCKHENGNLETRIKNISDQKEGLERKVIDLEQIIRRMESEKDALILALEDLEFALDKAETRTLNDNKEVERLRIEHERRQEEMENEIRKSKSIFQNALEDAQINIETERKAKSETMRLNQKLQNNIHDLESALNHAKRYCNNLFNISLYCYFYRVGSEMSLNVKKWQSKCTELQQTTDEEILIKEETMYKVHQLERRVNKTLYILYFIIFQRLSFWAMNWTSQNRTWKNPREKGNLKRRSCLT